jgi:hypothetical protein
MRCRHVRKRVDRWFAVPVDTRAKKCKICRPNTKLEHLRRELQSGDQRLAKRSFSDMRTLAPRRFRMSNGKRIKI